MEHSNTRIMGLNINKYPELQLRHDGEKTVGMHKEAKVYFC